MGLQQSVVDTSPAFPTTQERPSADATSIDQTRLQDALWGGLRNYCAQQQPDGSWHGDYGGPLFLLPGLVIACYITETPLSPQQRRRMVAYLSSVQNEDGGWGLHIESGSYVLGTSLNYVAMRILGVSASDPRLKRARAWLAAHGSVARVPSWGRFWLAVLGVYSWEGVNPVPPELWLLPTRLPMHPSHFWCHTRAVYLPVSYLYGRRAVAPETELIRQLRSELFVEDWSRIDWSSLRGQVAATDVCQGPTKLVRVANKMLMAYEGRANRRMRRRALSFVLDHIHHEDESTGYLDIGPVSKAFNMVAVWFADANSDAVSRHRARIADYLWDGEDGLKMQGYNSSQFWDTAFFLQTLLETDLPAEFDEAIQRAYRFVDDNQVRNDVKDHARYFRDPTKGAWPFSTAEQAWPVTDCTGEGIKVAIALEKRVADPIAARRLQEAADFILAYQNDDGGWAPYEKARASKLLELFNPAEVFGNIMIDYSYVECTSSCIQGLRAFWLRYPQYRTAEIRRAIDRGKRYILREQRADGSWYGSWGICFTYGTWFGIEGLIAAGESRSSAAVVRACNFLVSKQRLDGGWGESYRSCVEKRWVEHRQSQVVNTAWALLGLLAAGDSRSAAIKNGVELLLSRQRAVGDWAQEGISGVFNRSCMIHYDTYRNVMPLWALARYKNYCKTAGSSSTSR